MAGSGGRSHPVWSNSASPHSLSPGVLNARPFSDVVKDPSREQGLTEYGTQTERPQMASPQASTSTPNGPGMPIASRLSNREGQQDFWTRRHSDHVPGQVEKGSVSFAVPYANTTSATSPIVGDRPIQTGSAVNGVSKHNRTLTPSADAPVPKSSKRALNLLNPVNLLMRRRTQVTQEAANDHSSTKGLKVPPMALPADYDPRIRGNVIHDFSAPRPRRELSSPNIASHTLIGQSPRPGSQSSPSPAHDSTLHPHSSAMAGPKRASEQSMFKEQFDDDRSDHHRFSAVQAEALANPNFLKRMSQQSQGQGPSSLPSTAPQAQQLDIQQFMGSRGAWQTRMSEPSSATSTIDSSTHGSPRLSDLSGQCAHTSPNAETPSNISQTHRDFTMASSPGSPPTADPRRSPPRGKVSSEELERSPETGLPKHMKSNASRFSFQLGGNDSALQELLLEERAKDQRASVAHQQLTEDNDEDSFDENAMYDRDEFEGDMDDETSWSTPMNQQTVPATATVFPLEQPSSLPHGSMPVITTPGGSFIMQPNANAQQHSDRQPVQATLLQAVDHSTAAQPSRPTALVKEPAGEDLCEKRSDSHQGFPQELLPPPPGSELIGAYRRSRASHDFDDDLYFNGEDSEGYPADDEELSFHEGDALFDSDYEDESATSQRNAQPHVRISEAEPISRKCREDSSPGLSKNTPFPKTSLSTQEGLTAYHTALAEAAQRAAGDGNFIRTTSSATTASIHSQRSGSPRPLTLGKEAVSRQRSLKTSNTKAGRDSYSGFDFGFTDPHASTSSGTTPQSATFAGVHAITTESSGLGDASSPRSPNPYITTGFDDDDLSDDAIINEANALALASDDEGFYGREFGFYARPRPGPDSASASSAEILGGFFGAPGSSNIKRKQSVREPNLTPITERSEFSTRNSFASGYPPSATAAAMSSPAFAAQMARLSPLALAQLQQDDEELERALRARGWTEGTGRSGSVSSLSSAGQVPWANGRGSWTTVAGTGGQFGPLAATSGQRGSAIGGGGGPVMFWGTDSSRSSVRMSRSQSEMHEQGSWQGSPSADSPGSTDSAKGSGAGGANRQWDVTPRKAENAPGSYSPKTAVKERARARGGETWVSADNERE